MLCENREKRVEESGPLPGTAKTEEAQREEGRAWFKFLGLLSIIKHTKMQPYSKPLQLHSFSFETDCGPDIKFLDNQCPYKFCDHGFQGFFFNCIVIF